MPGAPWSIVAIGPGTIDDVPRAPCCIPEWSMPLMAPPAIADMSWPISPCPMSSMVRMGLGSTAGTGARRPSRTASVPLT